MRPDMGGLRMSMRGEPDDFYHNDGAGHFTRVPLTSGRFHDANGQPLAEDPESFGLGAKFVDLNGDGAPDLYVANDFEDLDQLWFNDGHGNFRLADWTSQRQMSNSAMGFDVADVNGDGLPDLFGVDMLANDSHRLKTQIPTHTAFPKKPGEMELRAAAAAQHAVPQSRRRHVRRAVAVRRRRGERMVVVHDVHGRRSRRMAGHSHRQRTSLGHHGRRHPGAAAESPHRRSIGSGRAGSFRRCGSRTSRSEIAAT